MTRTFAALVAAFAFFLLGASAHGQELAPLSVAAPAVVEINLNPDWGAVAIPQGVDPWWEGPMNSVPPDGYERCPAETVPAVSGTPDSGEAWDHVSQAELNRHRADLLRPDGERRWLIAAQPLDDLAAVWCLTPPPLAVGRDGARGATGPAGPAGKDGRDMMFTLALTGGGSFINNPSPDGRTLLPVGFGRLEGGLLLPLNEGSAAIGPFVAGTAGVGGQYAGEVGGRFVAFPGQLAALSLSAGYFHQKVGWQDALYDYALNGAVGGAGLIISPEVNGNPIGVSLVVSADGLTYEVADGQGGEAPWGIGARTHAGILIPF